MSTTADILPLGPDGILVRFSDALSEPANRAALAFRAALDQAQMPGIVETATSLTSVFLRFDPDASKRTELNDRLGEQLAQTNWLDAALPEGRTLWRVPASFGGLYGPDLEEAADLAGVSCDAAIQQVTDRPLRVLALGFAPGQPYLGFLESNWDIPRQTAVTPEVPQGAVVVAVRQLIPFANAAPTGWRQIGRTAFRCFDDGRDPAIALKPGDEVCFDPIEAPALDRLLDQAAPDGGAVKRALP